MSSTSTRSQPHLNQKQQARVDAPPITAQGAMPRYFFHVRDSAEIIDQRRRRARTGKCESLTNPGARCSRSGSQSNS